MNEIEKSRFSLIIVAIMTRNQNKTCMMYQRYIV